MISRLCAPVFFLLLLAVVRPAPASTETPPEWTQPIAPFKIVGNLYYVGSQGLASYLVVTPQGNILINSDLEANVPMLKTSVESLGFKWNDTKILLISHAHWDHDAGSAKIKQQTGASYMVMDADVPVVESGGAADFQYGADSSLRYPAAKVDHVLHDGDEVRLGGSVLIAHLTPGHTKGCTTWTTTVTEAGMSYNVVIVGSPNVNPGYKLVHKDKYLQIAEDYERMFRVLKSLRCDIFLGAHGAYFDMDEKLRRKKDGQPNPFIDAAGYKLFVAEKEQEFLKELEKQKAAAK